MRSKIIALGIVLVLLASGIGTALALSNSGGGEDTLITYIAKDESGYSNLYLFSSQGVTKLTEYDTNDPHVRCAEISPDGTRVAYVRFHSAPHPNEWGEIRVVNTDGSDDKRIAGGSLSSGLTLGYGGDLRWIGNDKLLSAGRETAGGPNVLYEFDMSGNKEVILELPGKEIKRPDLKGDKITFDVQDNFWGYTLEIYAGDFVNGGVENLKKLTSTSTGSDSKGNNYDPSLSPDLQKIVFISQRFDGVPRLWIMDIEGSNQKCLSTNFEKVSSPVFVDNFHLIFSGYDGNQWDIYEATFNENRDEVKDIVDITNTGNIDETQPHALATKIPIPTPMLTPTPTPRQTPIPIPSTVDFAQHSATDSGDFVILTNDGRVYEVDPRHLSDIQLRTSTGPVNVAAVIPDLYDDSILAFTEDGKLYQCKDSENWANWNKVGDINLPSGSKIVDFAQHSAADSGDFVILTNDGRVYEVDPRHLSDIQLRTSAGPVNVAAVIPDRYDNSILAVTSDGVLYRATTDDDWNTWAQVGRVRLSVGSKIVDFAQHSAVTTGDFVFLTDDGKVYEVDPRRLSIFEFRTANGPSDVVAMKPNTYDNSILALTDSGVLYRAITDDDWNTWTQVGRIQFPTTKPTPAPTPIIALSNAGGGDWKYYKEITIKKNSGEYLRDYQVLVELNSANFDFSKAKSDGSDIRFSADGEELNYWIEEWNAGAKKAKIWIKVLSIPANGERKIKMYYGNPSASAVSDGDKVFEFFDDGESHSDGQSLTTGGWSIDPCIPEGPNAVIRPDDTYEYDKSRAYQGSLLSLYGNSYDINVAHHSFTEMSDGSGITEMELYDNGRTYSAMFIYSNSASSSIIGWYNSESTTYYVADWGAGYYHLTDVPTRSTGWHQFKMVVRPNGSIEYWVDGTKSAIEAPTGECNDLNEVGIRDYANSETWADRVRVRKYTSPEPTPIKFSPEYPATAPTPTAPILVPAGEEKGISGFDAINSLRIEVQEDGDADFSAQYSLSWWEQFYLWIKEALGDRDATKNFIESKIESNLEREVESLEISEDGRASFVLKDYVGKVERNEGTWYWTKIYLSEGACERINLGTVSVIFPDGFIYEFDGKLPNVKHLEDENLAKLYLEAKITKGIYEAIYCQYEESQIGKAAGDFIAKIDMELINMIATSPIPYSEFASLIDLAKDFKTVMEEYNKILDNMMAASYTWGEILGHRIGFSNDVKNMAELKEEEINLIYSITSNDEISYESRESLKQELIDNLEIQKGVIVKIKGSASDVSISGTDPLNVKEIKQYFNEIFKNTRKLADTDLKYVEQGLTTLKGEGGNKR